MCWLQYFHFNPAQFLRMLSAWLVLDFGIKKSIWIKLLFIWEEKHSFETVSNIILGCQHILGKTGEKWSTFLPLCLLPQCPALSSGQLHVFEKKAQIPLQFWSKPRQKKKIKLITLKLSVQFQYKRVRDGSNLWGRLKVVSSVNNSFKFVSYFQLAFVRQRSYFLLLLKVWDGYMWKTSALERVLEQSGHIVLFLNCLHQYPILRAQVP